MMFKDQKKSFSLDCISADMWGTSLIHMGFDKGVIIPLLVEIPHKLPN